MKLPRKAQLRNTLKKLAAIQCERGDPHDRATSVQEALDFIAMLAGFKPVFLLGRGFNDPAWIEGVLAVARGLDLHAIEGPYWEADEGTEGLPPWFVDHMRAAFAGRTAWYVCRARGVADEVRALDRDARPTVEQEARLLGYPQCCVAAHYARNLSYQRFWLDLLRRKAGDDESAMRRLLADGSPIEPETDDERGRLESAMKVAPAPFTSVNMCDACDASDVGPAKRLSRQYADLAATIDRGLAATIVGRRPS